jgi:pimeloyl-ACP methyl ester carboxylesterase
MAGRSLQSLQDLRIVAVTRQALSRLRCTFLSRLLCAMMAVLAACGPTSQPATTMPLTSTRPPAAVTTRSPTATFEPNKIDVGGYKLYYQCFGQGTPPVIVEPGLGGAPTVNSSWALITAEIQKLTRICIYDRAGLGRSDKAPLPRTSNDVARDLHNLLGRIPVPGPYIFAAHSMGGFHVRVFAHLYPREVAGIVLVDSSHPDQENQLATAFPTVSLDEPAAMATARYQWTNASFIYNNPEGLDWNASTEQVRNAGSLGTIPLIVISRNTDPMVWGYFLGLSEQDNHKPGQLWQALQRDLVTLSPNSSFVTAATSDHDIQIAEPSVVIDAIAKLVQKSRNP